MSRAQYQGNNPNAYLSKIAKNSLMTGRSNSSAANQNYSSTKVDVDQSGLTGTNSEIKNVSGTLNLRKYPSQNEGHTAEPHLSNVYLHKKSRSPSKHSTCQLDDESYRKTQSKLFNINFNHHDPNFCVCAHCNCGRHLCKMHIVKPDLHVTSIYRGDYDGKKPIGPLSFRPKSSKMGDGPHIDMKSMYGKDFVPKGAELERPHPEDLLGVGGPAANLTTYSSGFPGHYGPNQYIKPTNNANLSGLLPFTGNSVYRNAYVPKRVRSNDPYKMNDTLRVGQTWLGNTTYRENFRKPSGNYDTHYNPENKIDDGPHYAHQYETIYKNDFIEKGPKVCPAKIQLYTKTKGFFSESKANFNENADYKALSPEFHAISTSKHSYV